jgi:carbohydrate kinase (thermoresistant glucokinase family)
MDTYFMSMAASHPFSEAVVVMGVASCGKTTIGEALAKALQVPFVEGDRLHSAANVAKMSAGTPLTDDDRWPWLARVGEALQGPGGTIASCSALKKSYRKAIEAAAKRDVKFVHLHGKKDILATRMAGRQGHFMPLTLLDSQLAILEIPSGDENALSINVDQTEDAIVAQATVFLTRKGKKP